MSLKTRSRKKPEWLRWSRVKHVVYHGSRSTTLFDSFDPSRSDLGVHLGSLDQALYRIMMKGDPQPIDHGSVFPLWFKVSNLLRLKDTGSFHSDAIADQLARKKIISKALAKEIIAAGKHDWRSRKVYDPIVRDAIIKAGYDGVVYRNETEGAGDSWIAFHPQQLKSAIGNRGTFDPEDPVMTNPMARLKPAPKRRVRTRELAAGRKVEMEHTRSKRTAALIARHHLAEIPDYYTRLLRMEKAAKRRNPANEAPWSEEHVRSTIDFIEGSGTGSVQGSYKIKLKDGTPITVDWDTIGTGLTGMGPGFLWFAYHGGRSIAAGYLEHDDDFAEETGEPAWAEQLVAVEKAYRRKGLYSAVLTKLKRRLKVIYGDARYTPDNEAFWQSFSPNRTLKNPLLPLPPDFFPRLAEQRRQQRAIRQHIYEETGLWWDDLDEMMEALKRIEAQARRRQFRVVKRNPRRRTK